MEIKENCPENDFELLTQPYSLSVDMVSDDMKTCWNILSDNQKGEKRTKKYLDILKITKRYFEINVSSQRGFE